MKFREAIESCIDLSVTKIHAKANKAHKNSEPYTCEMLEKVKDWLKDNGHQTLTKDLAGRLINNWEQEMLPVESKSQWDIPHSPLEGTILCKLTNKNYIVNSNQGRKIEDLDHALYVLTTAGNLRIHKETADIHHDNLFVDSYIGVSVGLDVLCAGHLTIKSGKIMKIDNDSGHYRFSEDQLRGAVRYFDAMDLMGEGASVDVV